MISEIGQKCWPGMSLQVSGEADRTVPFPDTAS